jgi:hypothetical protein
MATSVSNVVFKQTTDAEFRAWGSAICTALQNLGVTKTADTGQIDWATVAKPAATNTVQGYEIRQFTDALQATAPIYIKLEFGSNLNGATLPGIWLTIGNGTDGAGTLTGFTSTRRAINMAAASNALMMRVGGDTNRFYVFTGVDGANTNGAIGFAVERTHDASGNDTDEGAFVLSTFAAATNIYFQVWIAGTGVISTETALPALLPSVGSGASGSNVALYPIFGTKGVYLNPLMNILIAFQANITPLTQISFTYYGATRAFIPISNVATPSAVRGAVAGSCFLIRDE